MWPGRVLQQRCSANHAGFQTSGLQEWLWGTWAVFAHDEFDGFLRRPVRRSRAQVKCWATIPVPDSEPVITDLGWHTDFAQHYVKVGQSVEVGGWCWQGGTKRYLRLQRCCLSCHHHLGQCLHWCCSSRPHQ